MPERGIALEKLGFLTIGLFDGQDPGPGHQYTLEMIELAERLGFDSAWLRCRHLQYGISSPIALLAAASQRTSRIELGTAVIPLGWENPLRLAEDLATVDVLSGGRINPGFSVGEPMHWADVREALYPVTADAEDFSYERVSRLLGFVAGERAATFAGSEGFEQFSSRVEPYSPGLRARMWYGGASLASARWAGQNDVRARHHRRVGADRAGAARGRGVPRGHRGRVRAAVHLRPRGLRADPHRHGHQTRPGARLAADPAAQLAAEPAAQLAAQLAAEPVAGR